MSAEQLKHDAAGFGEELTEEQLDTVAVAGSPNAFQKLFKKIADLFD